MAGKRFKENFSPYQEWAESHPYSATATETVAVLAGRIALRQIGKRIGVNLGNALTTSEEARAAAQERPLLYGAITIGFMPAVEELGARVIPNKICKAAENKNLTKTATTIRSAADICFAAWHAGIVRPAIKPGTLQPTFRLRQRGETFSLPVSQYIAGRNLRRIYEKRGYKPAVFSHALNNTISAGLEYRKKLVKKGATT